MLKTILILASCFNLPTAAPQESEAPSVTVQGLVTSHDEKSMCVRHPDGQSAIQWTDQTEVALEVNTRILGGLRNGVLRYKVHSSNQVIDFALPKGPITGIVNIRRKHQVEKMLAQAHDEHWIPESGLVLRFGEKPTEQLPSKEDPRFVGLWNPTTKPRTLSIKGKNYEISLKKGGQTNSLLFNVIDTKDCLPFVNRARVVGRNKGGVIIADEIHVQPIGDQTAKDDPKLPRYLFIGDSISGNYTRGLREALAGKFNLHHPPTNCGPSGKGKSSIVDWLGGYEQKGRHWDVISFNFGHWDAGNNKAAYQANLEAVIGQLEKTGAELIWVTTCPVPHGFPPAGDLNKDGKAPKRTSGVMEKYLNPWALEVMKRHPAISICDQWQYVKDNETELYKEFWAGKNVHFRGAPADKLGHFLAAHVLKVTRGD
jgi:acyl-CoA thioesterase-1